jgi:hypothetical protein
LIGRGGAPADEYAPIKIASGAPAATRMAVWVKVQRNLREIGRFAIPVGEAASLRRRRSVSVSSVMCRVRRAYLLVVVMVNEGVAEVP